MHWGFHYHFVEYKILACQCTKARLVICSMSNTISNDSVVGLKAGNVACVRAWADDPADMKVMPLPSSSIERVTVYGDAPTPGNVFESHPVIDVPDSPVN